MTRGPLLAKMLVFILPLIVTNLLQVCYNAADMVIVGFSPEADAVGAIGTTGAFTALVMNLLVGISVGANVVVARHIGARHEQEASAAVHTATVLGLVIGLIGAAAGFVYYGFESIKLVLVNFAAGAFSGILSFLYLPLGIVFLLAAGLGSFNKYTVTEENSDV